MKKQKRTRVLSAVLSMLLLTTMIVGVCVEAAGDVAAEAYIGLFDGKLHNDISKYFSSSVVALPDTVKDDQIISLIIEVDAESLLDAYEASDKTMSISEFAMSDKAAALRENIAKESAELIEKLDNAGYSYELGLDYDTVLAGFELLITARDFEDVCKTLGTKTNVIVGDVYKSMENKLVENTVNVQDTGIFNSVGCGYDGSGTVVAVLDTGLDYYHTAFSTENFTADKLGMTFEDVEGFVGDTTASKKQAGLTASDVYISTKVPYGFDYADGDADVFPIHSDHGTHVAGVIAGKDDVVTGVAPNAQLAIMKIFSDIEDTARTSWILGALEDCVVLEVDVINMSIGTSAGFSRENDKEQITGVYDRIRELGISMVVAASNSFTSTYGSEKNGNLGLTSNPDNGTVGSPSTYKGALSVASVNGAKTPYMLYGETIIYYIESTDRVSEEKEFVADLLPEGVNEAEYDFVTIPGAGRSADYTGIEVKDKIVLVSRGSTTFEEKAQVAEQKGAAGIIIYNNVAGDIKMTVGDAKLAVCSISQDEGEMLAAVGTGKLKISRGQTSGPFMSDFSSWGPSPDLEIKPEITAHGGMILSSVPGQGYDRISGTSMACPNVSGLVAILRQYVRENFPAIADNNVEIAAVVNRLLMSTADIVLNKNGLPYAVRKQGAGLANLTSAIATDAYILTKSRKDGSILDKSKIELGDDPEKKGVYTLNFSVYNFGSSSLSYDISAYVMTEGISDTKTNDGKYTVDEQGYLLENGTTVEITNVSGGTLNDKNLTVAAGATADVTITITLSDADREYMNKFENGMYIEGHVTLTATAGTEIDLSVPYLVFYGDWTVAPLFDIDYFETNADEIDDSIDLADKTLPDAYATRPVGSLYDDYVSFMGGYYFEQDPASKLIAADRKYISISNVEGTVHSLEYVWGGLLRSAERIEITITNDATGEVVFEKTEKDIRKSYGDGGSIYPANIKIGFDAYEQQLENNTRYTVTLKGFLDYGDGGEAKNLNNTFTFPIYVDFSAPAVTGVEYYTEYDRSAEKTRLYAKVAVYDNHYSMGAQFGYVSMDANGEFVFNAFDKYITSIYSDFNSTSYVVYELTDYVARIKENAANANTFTIVTYDYALNTATYELSLPDEYVDMYFEEESITLSPNQTYDLRPILYPGTEWSELLQYYSTNMNVADIVGNKVIALKPGVTRIVAQDPVTRKTAHLALTVLGEGDEGFQKFDKPVTDNFILTGFYTKKAYFQLDATERDIGSTGDEQKFVGENYFLSMFPSEEVTLRYRLDAFFPKDTKVVFESSNENIVKVDENGNITAMAEGFASISVNVLLEDKPTYYSKSISVEVKEPWITSGPSLAHYFGLGGTVTFPETLAVTEIGQFAFSNYDYVPKTENDEISEEVPETTKMWYLGDNTIEEVIIPEGVEKIGRFAFANLTALRRVVLPSTLHTIDYGAFAGCTSLVSVEGIGNVKFINEMAFMNCNISGAITLTEGVALGEYAFANNKNLQKLTLTEKTKSVASYAFSGCAKLKTVVIEAEKIKLGQYVFSGCEALKEISVNASVIPAGSFADCKNLTTVTIGRDVAVIGENAFRGTKVASFTVAEGNTTFKSQGGGAYLLSSDGKTVLLCSPIAEEIELHTSVTTVADGAFSGNPMLTSVKLPGVTKLGNYAFAGCEELVSFEFGKLTHIGDSAFSGTAITETPDLSAVKYIGSGAFRKTAITSVKIADNAEVGANAFRDCAKLETVTIGNGATIGANAFRSEIKDNWTYEYYRLADNSRVYYYVFTSPIHSLTVGNNVKLGNSAFYNAAELTEVKLGSGVEIGDYAFYNASKLEKIDLSKVKSIGAYAFSGDATYEYLDSAFTAIATDKDNNYLYHYHAPLMTSIDISSAEKLGEGAFSYMRSLKSVKSGAKLTEIADSAFYYCSVLESVTFASVEKIGKNAFAYTALKSADLSKTTEIGDYAFTGAEALASVKFADGVKIGEGAFGYCTALTTLTGAEKIASVGNYGFAYSALTQIDLSGAEFIGTHAFIKEEKTPFKVTLGEKLTNIGDNPFAMCILEPFAKVNKIDFNGKVYDEISTDYDLSESVKVIGGSLYRVVPNGIELITYAGEGKNGTVADGTVRISAMAFAGNDLKSVSLPKEVASIGHKAFFGCDSLTLVTFQSYNAPILEEEFDYNYFASFENIPATGDYTFVDQNGKDLIFSGLGIVDCFMWNAADAPYVVYYGANFIDYIGHVENKITMVRPANGKNYDSFILSNYFDNVLLGAAAADDVTLAAIDLIDKLPETVSLEDKAVVEAARVAYDSISTLEQRALVTNYQKLTEAEARIEKLLTLENGETTEPPVEDPTEEIGTPAVIIIILTAVLVIAVLVIIICDSVTIKKNKKSEEGEKKDENETDKN